MIIQGKIIDKESKAPIPYIRVKLDNLATPEKENIVSSANFGGDFSFDVPEGAYQLEIRSPIHEPYTEKIFGPRKLIIELRRIIL
ncbi:MAG: carboxypeptidase regulatory-like domain-containing protein [Promethearchaeota archaeon]